MWWKFRCIRFFSNIVLIRIKNVLKSFYISLLHRVCVCVFFFSLSLCLCIYMCVCVCIYCIAVIHIQLYTYTRGNKINNNDERTHFFRKIYLSHFIRNGCERVVWERWVGDWTNCNILTPSSFVFSSTSFSFCWAAQSVVLRAHRPLLGAGSLNSILSPTWLTPTNWTSCRTGLYHCLTSTCFLWASHLPPIQLVHSQGYTLVSSTGCTCSLIYGWVEGQYVIYIYIYINSGFHYLTSSVCDRPNTV